MWADVLGAIFSSGSQLAGQNRLRNQEEEERKLRMQRERQIIDMALRDQQLQEDESRRQIADRLISNIGPMGMVDEEAAGAIKAGGLGGRLKTQEGTLDSTKFLPGLGGEVRMSPSPGLQAGTILTPNRQEQLVIDQQNIGKQELDRQTALREHLMRDPSALFAKGPMSAAVIWEQAGFKGDPPQDMSQLKEKMDYEHKLRLAEIGARTSGDLQVARLRSELGVDRPMTQGQNFNATMSVAKKYTSDTKAAREVNNQLRLMRSALQGVREGREAAGSQGVLVTFQKILDPTSVVRESEYERSGSGLALKDQLQGQWERIKQGGAGVPVQELEQFVQLAEAFARGQSESALIAKQQAEGFARQYGLPLDLVAPPITNDAPVPGGGGGQDVAVERDPVTGKLLVRQ